MIITYALCSFWPCLYFTSVLSSFLCVCSFLLLYLWYSSTSFLSSLLLIFSCVIRGFLTLLSPLLTKSLSGYYIFLDTVPLRFHIPAFICDCTEFSFLEYLALPAVAHVNSPNDILVSLFGNLRFFFNWLQIFETSNLWSGSISDPGSIRASFNLFQNRFSFKNYIFQGMSISIFWCFPGV